MKWIENSIGAPLHWLSSMDWGSFFFSLLRVSVVIIVVGGVIVLFLRFVVPILVSIADWALGIIRRSPVVTLIGVSSAVAVVILPAYVLPILVAISIFLLVGALLVIFNQPGEDQERRWDRIFYVALLATAMIMVVVTAIVEHPLIDILYPGPAPSFMWLKTVAVLIFLVLVLPFFLFWDDVVEALEDAHDALEERSGHINLQRIQPAAQPQVQQAAITQQPSSSPGWFEKTFGTEGKLFGKFLPVEVAGEFLSKFIFRLIKLAE